MGDTAVSVEDYIAGFPPNVQVRLRAVREAIRRSAPKATESISYGMPAYRQDGVLIYFAGYKDHVGLYPLSAAIRQALGATLAPYDSSTAKATAQFRHDRPIPRGLIARIVRLRVRENQARSPAMAVNRDRKRFTPESQLRDFIGRLDPKNQKLFRSVRAAVRRRFPTAHELAYDYGHALVIGYAPADKGIESVVAIRASAAGVCLYFSQGPRLPDPKRLLQGTAKRVRFIQLETASRLLHPDVEALIAATVAQARVPLPPTGKGSLIIKSDAAKKARR